jgi:hypothetical protein
LGRPLGDVDVRRRGGRGTLVFEVNKTAEVARFRLTLKAGTPARTTDWTL